MVEGITYPINILEWGYFNESKFLQKGNNYVTCHVQHGVFYL